MRQAIRNTLHITNQINQSGLEPIFLPWEAPDKHRRPNPTPGGATIVEPGRRESEAMLVPRIREAVDECRETDYAGASDTTRLLLDHWFRTEHSNGFRNHFAQRGATESFVWLYEVAKYHDLSSIYSSLFGEDADEIWEKQITLGAMCGRAAWRRSPPAAARQR